MLSREAFFLLNNLVLVALCVVIFWGTFFPLISEALTGTKRAFGPPMFERWTVPLALALVLLAGVGPMLTWRRATPAALRRAFRWPLAMTLAALVLLLVATPATRSVRSLIMFALIAFVLTVIVREFARGAAARRTMSDESWPAALRSLVTRNRRRYGGYLVHAGIAVLFLGVAASSGFRHAARCGCCRAKRARVAGYTVSYDRPTSALSNEKITFGAVLRVTRDGRRVAVLRPSREYYPSQDLQRLGAFGRFFDGEATRIRSARCCAKDVWVSVQPDVTSLRAPIDSA